MILIQYIMQCSLIVFVAIIFIPIFHDLAFEVGLFDNIHPRIEPLVSSVYTWSLIFFIAGIAGNTFWLGQALQRERAEVQTF